MAGAGIHDVQVRTYNDVVAAAAPAVYDRTVSIP